MGKYIRYYVTNSEIYDVREALKILSEKRLINKFAKSANISQPTLSNLVNGKTDLSGCTITVYNKIVSNIDNFLNENNKEN